MSHIKISLAHWALDKEQLCSIRKAVFVDEQNVPIEEEIDQRDEQCRHVKAVLDSGEIIATGRLLPDGKIGRMCVKKSYRKHGIGNKILRALIKLAIKDQHKIVYADAQLSALPFYQTNGFIVTSDIFMDAGIEHKKVSFKIDNKFIESLAKNITDRETAQLIVREMVQSATQQVLIYSHEMESDLYNHEDICESLSLLVRSNKRAEISILAHDTSDAVRNGHCLINLAQKLSTFVHIRVTEHSVTRELSESWLIVDGHAYCRFINPQRFEGKYEHYNRTRCRKMQADFNELWEQSVPDITTRRLNI